MIKFPDGELRDYLPATMKNDVDMVCLSYAIKKGTERLMKYRKATMIYHFIDCVPEPILDLLAAELRSLYYSDALPIETKRSIVKNTLRWHMQAGTPGAVAEMVKIVFGEGEVVEWPDFDEPPYTPGTFDIVTSARLTPDILDYFSSIIDRVKNVRSHLRRILIKREWILQEYAASGVATSPRFPVTNNATPRDSGASMQENVASAVTASPYEGITNNAAPRDAGLSMKEHASAVALAVPHETVTNHVAARASPLYASDSAGALAYASPKETVGNTAAAKSSRAQGAAAYFAASVSAAPCTAIGNTKAAAQDVAVANAVAAFSAFSTPRVQITNGKQERAVWLKYGVQGAAAFAAHPKITIGKGGMAANGRDF
jgi:Bacteriophage P2-related tail formation protein